MKKVISPKSRITAATDSGTIFYSITLDQLKEAFEGYNIWIEKAIEELGFGAINIKGTLIGCGVRDNIFYYCETDGNPITINGREEDPEEVVEFYPAKEFAQYVKESTKEIILDNISEYEFVTPNFDDWGIDLLQSGYSFDDLMEAALDNKVYWFEEGRF